MKYTNKKQVVCKFCGLVHTGANTEKFKKTYNYLKDGTKTTTLKNLCNSCSYLKYNKDNYYKNSNNRKFIKELKNNTPCADCNKNYPYYVMQFDHIPEKGEKSFTIGKDCHSVTREKLLKEIEKCEIVCSNCHAERTHSRRKKG